MDSCNGFYLWVDFRQILSPNFTFKKVLFEIFFKNGVYDVPGQALGSFEPGWFRFVFCSPHEFIIEGTGRIRKAVKEFSDTTNSKF